METHYEAIGRAHSALARERVLTDLKNLVRDSEDLLRATAGDVGEKAKEARVRLGAALEQAKVTCQEVQEQTMASVRAAAGQADIAIRAHPYESVGLGFGLGFLIGLLVRGR